MRDTYRLEDRYTATDGRVLLTGIQALARIPIDQLRIDRARGLDTAALVSGYPGSPLAGYDTEIARALRQVTDLDIVHQPAVNEELAASAVMGSQLAATRPDARHDGVVGIWYGKAPGLDRATDALRHGVFAGTAANSGAVVLVGDDPVAKSSTMPSSSDAALVDLHMPILYPGTTAECLELGLHAVAISRASGLWSAVKVITPVADGAGTVDLPVLSGAPVIPEIEVDGEPWRCTPSAVFLGPRMVQVEREFREIRLELAYRYGVENGLNRLTVDPPDAWIGLVATGFTYYQALEALRRLGLPDAQAIADAGIRLLHLRMPVPFDTQLVRDFARGLDEVLVVEEKNPTLEWLIKDTLYAAPDRPVVTGKRDPDGRPLLPGFGQLDADAIVDGLRRRLEGRLADRLTPPAPAPRTKALIPLNVNRTPFFCSGCPHNWGTKVPEDTLVGAGTGCHGMSLLMEPERVGETIGITAMGNEGANWIGMAPFVDTDHLVQNFGDGTYFHSGQLAVQAAIGAGTNVTFKILFNDTVAMTGGQDPVFRLEVPELVQVLQAQGAGRIIITTDDVDGYDRAGLPTDVDVWNRNRILEAQELLAAEPGVTILINHQGCAAEIRRARKRGLAPTPTERIVINHRICEGCGDCGDKSNCLSVQPIETPLGRKTAIDQATCNLDLSCIEGDCPAFMTVTVDDAAAAGGVFGGADGRPALPQPPAPAPSPLSERQRLTVRLAGIGGTGVVTVAQILSTAAMFDGWEVHGLDQTGLSQKAGPVVSDVVLALPGATASNLIGKGEADTVLALDGLVAASDAVIGAVGPDTVVIGSSSQVPTGAMVAEPTIAHPTLESVTARLDAAAGSADQAPGASTAGPERWVDALALSEGLLGSAAPANVFVVGAALQAGLLPLSIESVERAVELNGVAVDANHAALAWGRQWIVDPTAVEAAARPADDPLAVIVPDLPRSLAARIDALGLNAETAEGLALRTADLIAYQNTAYAERFLTTAERVAAAEAGVRHHAGALPPAGEDGGDSPADPAGWPLTSAAAHSLHRLMAYKDEYEVARLATGPEAARSVATVAGAGASSKILLHPPLLRRLGLERKLRFGAASRPMLAALARGRRLRGTRLDPFGHDEVRRAERALIVEFEATLGELINGLAPDRLDRAVAIAELPDAIRGYEDLKLRRVAEYREAHTAAMADWRSG